MRGAQAALAELAALILHPQPLEEFLQQACDVIARRTSAAAAYIATVNASTAEGELVAVAGPARNFIRAQKIDLAAEDPGDRGLVAQVYQAGQSMLFNDLEWSPEFFRHRESIKRLGLGSAAGIRLGRHGRCRAVLGLVAKRPQHFTAATFNVAERMGALLVTAIEHEDERELAGRYTAFYAALADLNDLVARDCEPQELYEDVCRLITKLSPDLAATVVVRDADTTQYRVSAWSSNLVKKGSIKSLRRARFSADERLAEGQGLVGQVLRTGRSVKWAERDILASERPAPHMLHQAGSRAQLAIPIAVGKELEGALVLSANRPDYFTDDVQHVAERIAGNLGHGVKSYRQKLALEHQALTDTLTGLPNRTLLMDRLETAIVRAARDRTRIALGLIDLDRLKEINDQFGHAVGDDLIRMVAQRVTEGVREADTVARIAGDEFAVVLRMGDSGDSLEVPAQRLLNAISMPLELDAACFEITAGLGFACYPDDAAGAQDLMRRADLALHRAKRRGRNQWALFESQAEAELVSQRRTRQQFVQGIADGEVAFHYQPKVDMRTGSVFGAEALVRWRHPDQGDLSPGEWLPVIEAETRLSTALGRHALASVVAQLAEWHEKGLELLVSVNVSARHLQAPGFVEDVRHALCKRPDLAPYLALEVTETALMEDAERVADVLAACRRLGLRVALDDFGTGYASLAYLQMLPADVVKVDVDFVLNMPWEMRAFSIVAGTLQMAQMLGLEVVAEGVEAEEHGRRLLQLGCPLAQGYAISPALPPDEFENWMEVWSPPASWAKTRAMAITTMAHRLLAALVYHRGRHALIVRHAHESSEAADLGKDSCPLNSGADLTAMPNSLRSVHRELHRLEAGALLRLEQEPSDGTCWREELRACLNEFERLIDDEL